MKNVFPVLAGNIEDRGIKKSVIAKRLGVSERTLYSKLSGETSFTWEETQKIKNTFFPDMVSEKLFTRAEDGPQGRAADGGERG